MYIHIYIYIYIYISAEATRKPQVSTVASQRDGMPTMTTSKMSTPNHKSLNNDSEDKHAANSDHKSSMHKVYEEFAKLARDYAGSNYLKLA